MSPVAAFFPQSARHYGRSVYFFISVFQNSFAHINTVTRAERVKVEALNEKGEKFTLEADGLLAICVQHELDHLMGIVFVERLSQLKQGRIKTKLKKRQKHTI